jgi:phenylacetate-CoA ligase
MKHLQYRLVDLVRGTDALGMLARWRALQYESPQALAARKQAQLEVYFQALREAVPMFRGVSQFEELPVLNRQFVQTHRDALMNPTYRGKLVRKKTGGSTAEPLVYFTGTEAQSALWAGIFLAWEAAGWQLGERVAFLAGTSLFGAGVKQRIYYGLLNVQLMSAFDMSPPRMDAYADQLAKGRIKLIYGYASAIHRLARHRLEGAGPLRTSLRAVVCTAEMLTPGMRADIEAAFAVPCFSQYGSNDAGISAFECERRNGFHLLTLRSHVEVLEGGRLVSTDMCNHAMFLPRYEPGDLVSMSGRTCECGRGLPLIDAVIGRQHDVVVDPQGAAVHTHFFDYMFREDARIQSFQVMFGESVLSLNLHVGDLSDQERQRLESRYRTRVAASLNFPTLQFEFNQPFVTLANGKRPFVVRRDD